MSSQLTIPAGWRRPLRMRDLHPRGDGSFGRNGFAVRRTSNWICFEHRLRVTTDARQPGQSSLALWKCVADDADSTRDYEFHFPFSVLAADEEADLFESCLEWVFSTAAGNLPPGWSPPPRVEVEAWIPEGACSVQAGGLASQGRLVYGADRLQLEFPLVHELPANLSPQRREWLRCVTDDAQRRWRLVRVEYRAVEDRMTCLASVDMSGAPQTVMPTLFPICLDALRWVVSVLIWPVGCLANPGTHCPAWDVSPDKVFPSVFATGEVR